ncbi:pheophytinase, chloroplastic isoform X2 [Punica granatum]|uniref:Pheophytinase, chloroplastic isoform X2 n=1 Tax=Punica granatum TaxID=22663 RepID=A0A6P8CME1_PUNGR|nr:pheophytinase, chloroplastic isoform X2 [Punica granatum]
MDARVISPAVSSSTVLVRPSFFRRQEMLMMRSIITLPSSSKWKPHFDGGTRAKISRKGARTALLVISSSSASSTEAQIGGDILEIADIRDGCRKWLWKGQYSINYFVSGPSSAPPPYAKPPPVLLLVHGFGASIPHWRRNIPTLSEKFTVYAIDLLGFGASDKPAGFTYTMEDWAQLILDFLDEIVQQPAVLVGNSVGSLACVIAASAQYRRSTDMVCGLVLLNCAGGMNSKAIVDDWRIKLLLPLLWFFDFLLKQRGIASVIFERVKQRDNLKDILLSVYGNKASVDDELVEIIREPANDEGALDAFISIVTGPPGPNPVQLMPTVSMPVLVLWGDQDPFTPLDGPVGKYFSALPSNAPNVSLSILPGVGHCPHDDRPDLVHEKLLPWLDCIFSF